MARGRPNRGHVRPSPCPILLCARPEPLAELIRFRNRLCDEPFDPAALSCSFAPQTEDHEKALLVGYRGANLSIPVLGNWPMDDLSPLGIVELVREIVDQRNPDHDSGDHPFGRQLAQHAALAVEICRISGTLPDAFEDRVDGFDVEVCSDENGSPSFWMDPDDRGIHDHRLDFDPDVLESFAGRLVVPCVAYQTDRKGLSYEAIGNAMSDQEGIEVVPARPDPIELLRLHAHVEQSIERAAAAALGEEN